MAGNDPGIIAETANPEKLWRAEFRIRVRDPTKIFERVEQKPERARVLRDPERLRKTCSASDVNLAWRKKFLPC
jgi:hypothetical protein